MASGYYPLDEHSETKNWQKLKEAENNLEEVIENVGVERSQSDNAAIDGGYRMKLKIAKNLINDCYRE